MRKEKEVQAEAEETEEEKDGKALLFFSGEDLAPSASCRNFHRLLPSPNPRFISHALLPSTQPSCISWKGIDKSRQRVSSALCTTFYFSVSYFRVIQNQAVFSPLNVNTQKCKTPDLLKKGLFAKGQL